jgi:hypothetical protein
VSRDRYLSFLLFTALVLGWVSLVSGCQSTIQGGNSHKTGGTFEVSVPTSGGAVIIRDSRTTDVVKQPDVRTNQGLPSTATAKPGEIGGVSLKALPTVNRSNLIAGGLLIALGCAFLFIPLIKQPGTAWILIAAGVVTMVYPWALLIGLAVALVWYAWQKGLFAKRLVASVDHAMTQELSPDRRESFKGYLAERQDTGDAKIVAALKPKS